MKYFYLCMSIFFMSIILACSPKYSANKLPQEQIIFGSGGGFSGVESSYLLLKNGQIFRKNGLDSVWQAGKATKKNLAKGYYEESQRLLNAVKDTINDPENTYSFLEIRTQKTTENPHRFTWSRVKTPSQKSVDIFYRALTLLVREPTKKLPETDKN